MRSILDTSVLLGPPPEPIGGELAISAASLAEIHLGVLAASSAADRAARLRRLGAIERAFDVLPVDDRVARYYARIAAAVVASGRRPRVFDVLIAATAVAHGARLCTRNAADLVGAEGIVDIMPIGLAPGRHLKL